MIASCHWPPPKESVSCHPRRDSCNPSEWLPWGDQWNCPEPLDGIDPAPTHGTCSHGRIRSRSQSLLPSSCPFLSMRLIDQLHGYLTPIKRCPFSEILSLIDRLVTNNFFRQVYRRLTFVAAVSRVRPHLGWSRCLEAFKDRVTLSYNLWPDQFTDVWSVKVTECHTCC